MELKVRIHLPLVQGVIKYSNLHLYTKGILYLHKHEKVVETTLRFCLSKFCVTNITSTLNNIQPFADNVVYKDPNFILSREQSAEVQVEGFIIHGLDPIDFS